MAILDKTRPSKENDAKADMHCVQSMYLKPSGDMTGPFDKSAVLVLETDLRIRPGQPCRDMRLGDLLIALEDVIEMNRSAHKDVESVEILCMAANGNAGARHGAMRAS